MAPTHPIPVTRGREVMPLRPWSGTTEPPTGSASTDRFYYDTVCRLLGEGWLHPDDDVLVVAGGTVDSDVLAAAGLQSVTVSNLDDRLHAGRVEPFGWSYQDAENLAFDDGSFDVCITHLGLHHCSSPHRGLLEMMRVARRGVLFFEPQESLLTRIGVRAGLGQEYEVASVGAHGLRAGGVRNTPVPNYVYRWSAREVRKTVASFDPTGRPHVRFFYGLMVPSTRLATLPVVGRLLAGAVVPVVRALVQVMPSQANILGVAVTKLDHQRDLHPWLMADVEGPTPDVGWFARHFPVTAKPDRSLPT